MIQSDGTLTETRLFGVRLDVGNMAMAVDGILEVARRRLGGLVCVANVDMLTRAKSTPKLAGIMTQASFVVTDGMPLVWALRRLQGRSSASRVYGPGLVLQLCQRASEEDLSVFFYGGAPKELELLVQNLQRRFPALRIAGAVSPPMLPDEPCFDKVAIQTINDSSASILFVGLGCPKQEYWMAAQQPDLRPISVGVGLAFALIAGTKSQAPVWMRNAGLEWLYRLGQEPRRLWRRYLVGNSRFIWYVLTDWRRTTRPRASK